MNIFRTTFFKFLVVGGTGTLVNLIVFGLLVTVGLNYLISSILSFLVAVTGNYFFNSIWTFKNRALHKTRAKKYFEFVSISGINLLTNLLFLFISLKTLQNLDWASNLFEKIVVMVGIEDIAYAQKMFAQLVGIAFATILNYLGNKHITFNEKQPIHHKI